MTVYKVYSRSLVVGIISAAIYTFIGLVLFGFALDKYPKYLDNDDYLGWYFLGMVMFGYLMYILARATARRTIRIGIVGKKMIVRYSKMSFYSTPDFELPFYQITSYKDIRHWYGDRLKLKLADGKKLVLREKYLPFLVNRPYKEFIDLFVKNYETGPNSIPAMRQHFDAYSISESAISGFAPSANAEQQILPVPTSGGYIPEPAVQNTIPVETSAVAVKSAYMKARRSLHFHFITWLAIVFFIGLGTFLITAIKSNSHRYSEMAFSAAIMLVCLYTIVMYYLNTPRVETETIGITVRGKTHYWRDIKNMELTGKHPYRFILPASKEGMMLQFADGSVVYLHDHLYANLHDIRDNIERKASAKQKG